MKSFTSYIENNLLLNTLRINISENDLDIDVFNYLNLFDNIQEEPIYKDDNQYVIYVSKQNNIKSMWIEYNSKKISNKIDFNSLSDIVKNI